ncbi:MAG: DUF2283 domain-containing protein [Patescibacteria group bacterium]
MNRTKQKTVVVNYEPEADVLWWEMSKAPIDHAEEMGNMVVHFTKKNTPVLVEILEAKKFLQTARHLLGSRLKLQKSGARAVA